MYVRWHVCQVGSAQAHQGSISMAAMHLPPHSWASGGVTLFVCEQAAGCSRSEVQQCPSQQQLGKVTGAWGGQELMGHSQAQTPSVEVS